MSTWPSTVPHRLSMASVEYRALSNAVRTPFEAGPSKARPRSSAARYEISGTIRMNHVEFTDFRNFFEVEIKQGTQIFDLIDPANPDSETYVRAQFMDDFTASAVSAGKWIVSLKIRVYR